MQSGWIELRTRIIEGDAVAFKELYTKSIKELYGFGRKVCRDDALIEDCIQDVFVTLWNKRTEMGSILNIRSYIYTSLRNGIIKKLERHYNRIDNSNEFDDTRLSIQESEESSVIRKEGMEIQGEALKSSIGQLSPKQQEIIYLKYECGLSYDEIAEILDMKNQSLRNTMNRAITKLREIMGEQLFNLLLLMSTLLIIPDHI